MNDERTSRALAAMAGIDPAPTGEFNLSHWHWWEVVPMLRAALQHKLTLDERIARATEVMAENHAEVLRRIQWQAPERFEEVIDFSGFRDSQ